MMSRFTWEERFSVTSNFSSGALVCYLVFNVCQSIHVLAHSITCMQVPPQLNITTMRVQKSIVCFDVLCHYINAAYWRRMTDKQAGYIESFNNQKYVKSSQPIQHRERLCWFMRVITQMKDSGENSEFCLWVQLLLISLLCELSKSSRYIGSLVMMVKIEQRKTDRRKFRRSTRKSSMGILSSKTDFTSTASATVSTYGRVVLRRGTLLQAVRVVQDSQQLNTHPYPQPTRATIPNRHSFAGKYNSHLGIV
ncbi:hypothetical protein RF11_16285 [Thelohanellus kitauei]|uniref:Uncharacterized protein n=1 Tax=Thelohanellus kitauei TaxID=669202 RepID=A0A0C2MQ03_THEKT|nr:hypothetical protein RF11_16285 [Thelohanellus kitauei]